jgi:hypothetical protein
MLRLDSARVEAMDTSPLRSHAMQVPQRPSVQEWGASIPAANVACNSVSPAAIGTVWFSESRVKRKLSTVVLAGGPAPLSLSWL